MQPLSRRSGVWVEQSLTKLVYSVPSETLSLTAEAVLYEPLTFLVPQDALTLNAQNNTYGYGYKAPRITLYEIANTPSYLLFDNDSLVDTVYASDVVDYSRNMAFTDTVILSDNLSSDVNNTISLVETVAVRDTITAQLGVTTADTLNFTDLLSGDTPLLIFDDVLVSDTLSSLSTMVDGALADTVIATDSVLMVLDAVSVDTANTTDELITIVGLVGTVFDDRVTVVDVLSAQTATTTVLIDLMAVSDDVASIVLADSTNTVNITETLEGTTRQTESLTDTATLTDLLGGLATVYAPILADAVVATDSLVSITDLQLAGVLADTVIAGDVLYESLSQTIYVTNAETGAVSTYVFTPTISSMTDYQGVLYLAGPDGLYALDATQDEDGAVVWTIRTGFSNLGTDRLKRIRDINVQARTEGDTTVQVIAAPDGKKQEWNYRMPALTRDSYRDGVVKVGQGIQSVYYTLGLQGIGPAEIDQLRVIVEPLSRRR